MNIDGNLFKNNPVEEIIENIVDNYKINITLGEKYFNEKQYEKAVKYYDLALKNYLYTLNIFKENNIEYDIEEHNNKINHIKSKIAQSLCEHGNFHAASKNYESAVNSYKEALLLDNKNYMLYFKIGQSLQNLRAIDLAADFYSKASSLNPGFDEPYRLMGDLYSFYENKNYFKAIENYEKYSAITKTNPFLYSQLGYLYGVSGFVEKSLKYLNAALALKPDLEVALNNLLLNSLKNPAYSQEDIYKINKTSSENFLKAINIDTGKHLHHSNTVNKNRKLHIGYISAAFYHNVIMYYLEPIFENYDKKQFTVTCYSNVLNPDAKTERCKSLVDKFKDTSSLNFKDLATLINKDKVDILIDLDGHTADSKIFTLAYKPAPIQAIYCGYPNTTGLSTMDYIFTDRITVKEEESKFFTEQPFYLDFSYECYKIHEADFPSVLPLPALENKYITFGSFNCLSKINTQLITLWAKILKAVPSSKMLIHRVSLEDYRKNDIINQFKENGINEDRLILSNEKIGHYNMMNKADIVLDTFPYNGTTTTIDSIMMGLPVICIYGDAMQKRPSSRINTKLGLTELIAKNEEEYIKIAVDLSSDINKLQELRMSLRDKFKNSPICDHKGVTKGLENAYIQMWHAWCDKQSKV